MDLSSQVSFTLAVGEGGLAVQQLINEDSECPHIGLGTVNVLKQPFWRHVDGRPDIDILKIVLGELGEPEIRYLSNLVMQEYIGDFKVAVDDIVLGQVDEPFENIGYEGKGLRLREMTAGS